MVVGFWATFRVDRRRFGSAGRILRSTGRRPTTNHQPTRAEERRPTTNRRTVGRSLVAGPDMRPNLNEDTPHPPARPRPLFCPCCLGRAPAARRVPLTVLGTIATNLYFRRNLAHAQHRQLRSTLPLLSAMALVVADGATRDQDAWWWMDVVPEEQQVALQKAAAFEPLTAADRSAGNMYRQLNTTTRKLIEQHPVEMRGLEAAKQLVVSISVAVSDDAYAASAASPAVAARSAAVAARPAPRSGLSVPQSQRPRLCHPCMR